MKAIRLENVGKKFILTHHKDRPAGNLFSSFPGQKISADFWALRNINMELEKGKVVGIIGRNGSGKTTLLNILAGISSPTMGKVEINGRVSSLLTLGAGFQEELTGKENIYLNSSILGMTRAEINKKYRSIVEFSELDGFLDSPLHAYSQGMRLRLGFSVATHMDFDILLIDEILSVGDVSFQKKCFDKIEEFRKQQKTMVITTQSLDVIERLCEEAFLLENGEIAQKGSSQKVAARYLELLNEKKLPETFQRRYSNLKWWADKSFWDKKEGSKEAEIIEVKIFNSREKQTNKFKTSERIKIDVYFDVKQEVCEPHFGIAIFREDGVYCYGPNTSFDGHGIPRLNKGKGFFSIEHKSLLLAPGKYRLSAAIWDKNELWAYDYHVGFYKFEVMGENKNGSLLNLDHKWQQPDAWWGKIGASQIIEKVDIPLNFENQNSILSPDIGIRSVDILDLSDNPKSIFYTGEDVKIKLQFKFLKKPYDYYLWIGLFRNDDVYCHGASKRLERETNFLIYPNLPLLTGEYYLSIVVLAKGQKKILLYHPKVVSFNMSFAGNDHGTLYLEHNWKWNLP